MVGAINEIIRKDLFNIDQLELNAKGEIVEIDITLATRKQSFFFDGGNMYPINRRLTYQITHQIEIVCVKKMW